MFGLSKEERIKNLKIKIEETRKHAAHVHSMREGAEYNAFNDLSALAIEMGVSANDAAKTKKGIEILSEVVLNRQYAFYLNETAIQLHSELKRLIDSNYFDINNKNQWLYDVVMPVGGDLMLEQMPEICAKLISDVEENIK